jgi:endonuclease/exonuclease/phosphatase family metal-dependent hydrolase
MLRCGSTPGKAAALFASLAIACCAGCGAGKSLKDLDGKESPSARIDGNLDGASSGGRSSGTIRIASFNIQVFGEKKIENARNADRLASIIRQFDVVAIQEIRARAQDFLPRFVDIVNADGSRYDYVIGPQLGRTSSKEQYAFLFDSRRIEIARRGVYTVEDPQDFLHREPLVARFRVRGPSSREAFTFSLINIHTDPDEAGDELNVLDDVFRVVQDDGTGEDDVILLGDLNVNDRKLGQLGQVPGMTWVISGQPTNTRQNQQYDNILFDRRATIEFTGNAGVYDFQRELGLSLKDALELSDHFPVWAEFSAREGASDRVVDEPRNVRTR